jgi:hypothetical protein
MTTNFTRPFLFISALTLFCLWGCHHAPAQATSLKPHHLSLGLEQLEKDSAALELSDEQLGMTGLPGDPPRPLALRQRLLRLGKHPAVEIDIIGQSREGRPVYLLTLGHTGPGVWLQGGIHGDEFSAVSAPLLAFEKLLTQLETDPNLQKLLQRTRLYYVPLVNPDGYSHTFRRGHHFWRGRFNRRPVDENHNGTADDEDYVDLNGDGIITSAWKEDPKGTRVPTTDGMAPLKSLSLQEQQKIKEEHKPLYSLLMHESQDSDGNEIPGEDPEGGIDLNRNYPTGHDHFGPKVPTSSYPLLKKLSGEPLSESESSNIWNAIKARPQILVFADIHNYLNQNMIFSRLDTPQDQALIEELGQLGEKITGMKSKNLIIKPGRYTGMGMAAPSIYTEFGCLAQVWELPLFPGAPSKINAKLWAKQWQYMQGAWTDQKFCGPVTTLTKKILVGGEPKPVAWRQAHPKHIPALADSLFIYTRALLKSLPQLQVMWPEMVYSNSSVPDSIEILNLGSMGLQTEQGQKKHHARPLQISLEMRDGQTQDLITLPGLTLNSGSTIIEVRQKLMGSSLPNKNWAQVRALLISGPTVAKQRISLKK